MTWFREAVQAAKSLRRRPLFASLTLLTIALGIAANTSMFSVLYAVILDPLPFRQPEDLAVIDSRTPQGFNVSVSMPNYEDWRDRNRFFGTLAAATPMSMTLTRRGPAEVLAGMGIRGAFFETFGVTAARGRLIHGGETEPGAPLIAVLGQGYWQRAFGGDPGALGETLTLRGQPYTIVGVVPEGFGWPSPATEVYVPLGSISGLPWNDRNSGFGASAIGRLKPGATWEDARADLARIGREIQAAEGPAVGMPRPLSFKEYYLGDVETPLWVLMGGVVCVLLIAIANVASLQLTRGEERRRELAIRTALGATRGRLARHLLIESLLLTTVGGALGIAIAWIGTRALLPFLPAGIPMATMSRIGMNVPVLLFALLITGATGLLFGALPAWRSSSVHPGHDVQGTRGSTSGRTRLQSLLVGAEIGVAMVLLIGAGLLVQSFQKLRSVDKGFEASGLMSARLGFPSRYGNEADWLEVTRTLRERLASAPGAMEAAFSLLLPLSGRSWERRAEAQGAPLAAEDRPSVLYGVVSPEFFRVLGVPIVDGRGFTDADNTSAAPVTIIDERMAELFWPGESPLGKQVTLEERGPGWTPEEPTRLYRTVVGVTRNVRHYDLSEPSRIQAYVPTGQAYNLWGLTLYVIVRTTVPPADFAGTLRRTVGSVDADIPIGNLRPVEGYMDEALGSSRSLGGLFGAFASIALFLAAFGIFGVFSYSVVQRRREIGIRMALGADASRVLRDVLRRAMWNAGAGVVAGLGVALLLSRFVQGLLFGVSAVDPITYAGLGVGLLMVAGVAALIPARRATRVDPVVVLTGE